jgi:hypothetical protein
MQEHDRVAVRLLDSPLGHEVPPRGYRVDGGPARLRVAFHRDSRGVWEFADGGCFYGHEPQRRRWEVVEYERVGDGHSARWGIEACYRMVTT